MRMAGAGDGSERSTGGANKGTGKGKEKQDAVNGSRERSDDGDIARDGAAGRSAAADNALRTGGSGVCVFNS